jgi:hypothetical protein
VYRWIPDRRGGSSRLRTKRRSKCRPLGRSPVALDETLPGPFEWDVKRPAASLDPRRLVGARQHRRRRLDTRTRPRPIGRPHHNRRIPRQVHEVRQRSPTQLSQLRSRPAAPRRSPASNPQRAPLGSAPGTSSHQGPFRLGLKSRRECHKKQGHRAPGASWSRSHPGSNPSRTPSSPVETYPPTMCGRCASTPARTRSPARRRRRPATSDLRASAEGRERRTA